MVAPNETPPPQETAANVSRALEVAHAFDPDDIFPEVSFDEISHLTWVDDNREGYRYSVVHDEHSIGLCTVITDHGSNTRWFEKVKIPEPYQGNGYGRATYKKAIVDALRKGYDFSTSQQMDPDTPPTQTEAAKRIWEMLVRAGVAEVVTEFSQFGDSANFTKYQGLYIIRAAGLSS